MTDHQGHSDPSEGRYTNATVDGVVEPFYSWRALTWEQRRELLRRPRSQWTIIGPLCWNYCHPNQPSQSAEWADQCAALGCMCPCHRWGNEEYKQQ